MSPIPLTKWDSNLNHFRPVAMVPGTAKKPTLVDVHRTKKGAFAVTTNIMDTFYETYYEDDARYPPTLWQCLDCNGEYERTNNISESGNRRFKDSLNGVKSFTVPACSLAIKNFMILEMYRFNQYNNFHLNYNHNLFISSLKIRIMKNI